MEYFLLLLCLILLVIGVVGSVLPGLPGLPMSWLGLFSLTFIDGIHISPYILWSSLLFTIVVSVLDYVIPAQGTKRFGGTSYGVWGTNIGLVVGIIVPIPFGFILGPFLGALLGELLFDRNDIQRAFKAAIGSFIGFLVSTFMKIIVSVVFLIFGCYYIITNFSVWF